MTGADDAADAAWHPLTELPPLAFDHGRILADVIQQFARLSTTVTPDPRQP